MPPELLGTHAHRSRYQSRDVKKCQWNLRAPWKSARQELRNEPPHDIAVWLPKNPFLASLWIRSGLGWPERDFGVVIQLCHVGARFEALGALIFMAPSDSIGIFFTSLDCPQERCALIYKRGNYPASLLPSFYRFLGNCYRHLGNPKTDFQKFPMA